MLITQQRQEQIGQWHWGQLAILWLVTAIAEYVFFFLSLAAMEAANVAHDDPGQVFMIYSVLFVGMPAVMLWLTWIWFGARGRRPS